MLTEPGGEQARKRSPLWRLLSWQSLTTIASLGIGALGLLLAYWALQEPQPQVHFETISETNVLDLHRPLQDLSIVFRGQNVQEQNLNLRIVTVNVANSGEVDILPSHYDQQDNWGMQFENGEVLEARLVDTSSEYLGSKVIPRLLGSDAVAFPKIIFEKGSYFTVEVLLLHPKDESPSISSVGKIAGIDEITVLARPLVQKEASFVTQLFKGGALLQVVRAIVYFVGFLVAIVAVVLAMIGIGSVVSNLNARRRRNRISQTRTIRQMDQQDMVRQFLVDHYESSGDRGLKGLQQVIKDPERMMWLSLSDRWILRYHDPVDDWPAARMVVDFELSRLIERALDDLMTMGILKTGEGDNAVIDPTFSEAVDSLLSELEG